MTKLSHSLMTSYLYFQADVMRSYSELSRRINPFWEEVMALLVDDQNQTENAERNQVEIDKS